MIFNCELKSKMLTKLCRLARISAFGGVCGSLAVLSVCTPTLLASPILILFGCHKETFKEIGRLTLYGGIYGSTFYISIPYFAWKNQYVVCLLNDINSFKYFH